MGVTDNYQAHRHALGGGNVMVVRAAEVLMFR
jgi:hypothetical protein